MSIIDNKLGEESVKLQKMIDWWQANRHYYEQIVDTIHDWGGDAVVAPNSVDITFTGGKRELTGLFRTMRRYGFKPNRRPEPGETSYYTFWYSERFPDIRPIWTHFTSSVCKRVQVGTEMKEVPVYEVQCSEPMEVSDD